MANPEQQLLQFSLNRRKPYFGPILATAVERPALYAYLQRVIAVLCQERPGRPIRVLEVGAWAGASAITWADAIQTYNQGHGEVFCIDPWQPYFDPSEAIDPMDRSWQEHLDVVYFALSSGEARAIFDHNIEAAGVQNIVRAVQGTLQEVAFSLAPGSFDVVFLDGDPAWTSMTRDLELARGLVSDGGMLCGGGLELCLRDVDATYARQRGTLLLARDATTGAMFHPGVTLAMAEAFGDVEGWDGFWAMQRRGGEWHQPALGPIPAKEQYLPKPLRGPRAWPQEARDELLIQVFYQRLAGTTLPESPVHASALSAWDQAHRALMREAQRSVENVRSDGYIQWLCNILGGWLNFSHPNLYAFDYAVRHMPPGGAVLEIGSFLGMSTIIISYLTVKHRRENPVFSCDPWHFEGTEKPIGGYFDASSQDYRTYCTRVFKLNAQTFIAEKVPHTVERFSEEFLEEWARDTEVTDVFGRQVRLGGPLSFAYIDGAHTYEGVRTDFLGVDRALMPGGYVFFDDSTESDFPEVYRYMLELLENPAYELVFRSPNFLFRKR